MDPNLTKKFEKAAQAAQTLKTRPSNEVLLRLYSLYKQSSEGDVSGSRPGLLDLKGRAKFDAWAALRGMEKAKAQENYIALVTQLISDSRE